jgi:hypothetical protein
MNHGNFFADSDASTRVEAMLGDTDADRLKLEGYIIDIVSAISSTADKDSLNNSAGCVRVLDDIQSLTCITSVGTESTALGVTLIAGTNASDQRASEEEIADFLHWLNYFKSVGKRPPPLRAVNQAPD